MRSCWLQSSGTELLPQTIARFVSCTYHQLSSRPLVVSFLPRARAVGEATVRGSYRNAQLPCSDDHACYCTAPTSVQSCHPSR